MAAPGPGGSNAKRNISATTVISATAGAVFTVCVTTAGSTTGALYDNAATGTGNTSANLIGIVPTAVGTYSFYGFPFATGLVYVPGTGQVASIAYG